MTTTTGTLPDGHITWDDLKAEVDASYTPEQLREYEEAGAAADAQIALMAPDSATYTDQTTVSPQGPVH